MLEVYLYERNILNSVKLRLSRIPRLIVQIEKAIHFKLKKTFLKRLWWVVFGICGHLEWIPFHLFIALLPTPGIPKAACFLFLDCKYIGNGVRVFTLKPPWSQESWSSVYNNDNKKPSLLKNHILKERYRIF